jgi:hypothetical protein
MPFQEGNLSEQTSTTAAAAGGGTLTQRVSKWNFYSKSSGITTPANIQIFNVVMGSAYYR